MSMSDSDEEYECWEWEKVGQCPHCGRVSKLYFNGESQDVSVSGYLYICDMCYLHCSEEF